MWWWRRWQRRLSSWNFPHDAILVALPCICITMPLHCHAFASPCLPCPVRYHLKFAPIHPVPMGPPMGPGPPPFPMAPPGSTMGPGSTTVAGAKLLVSRRVFVLLKYEQQQVDNHHLKPLKPYHVKFKTPQKRRGPVAAHPENMSTSWRSGIFHCQVDPSSTRLANGQVRSGDVFWCLWMLHDS